MGLGNFRLRILLVVLTLVIIGLWFRLSSNFNPIMIYVEEYNQEPVYSKDDLKDSDSQRVLVTVYYESLCPDSRSFFLTQIVPTYQRISNNMVLEYVPYGKAMTIKTQDSYEFECQHGPPECAANIIHACAIQYIKAPDVLLDYLACMIKDNADPVRAMIQCASSLNQTMQIRECSNGEEGKKLLAHYGKMTNSLVPKLSFIPTITLNKDSDNQAGILKNLRKEICLRLKTMPKGCE